MKSDLRPAFYALPSGAWRDYVTLLHLPYTAWHLSYVVLGASLAPSLHPGRLAGLTLAFFLAVGVGAHALDEYQGRPLGTRLSDRSLIVIAACSISAAMFIGALAPIAISIWALPFVVFGGFIVLAYNLELWGGRFHSDLWFGVSWGAFPAIVGYWAIAERVDARALLVAAACFALSLAQRTLSKQVREIRRGTRLASGRVEYRDGRSEAIDEAYLLAAPETALRWLSLGVPLLAMALLAGRL